MRRTKTLNELYRERGASSWLTTIPLAEEGYDLTKQLFWYLIRIRYGWTFRRVPSNCECGIKLDIRHTLSWKKGFFVSLRHNHIRNIMSILLREVFRDVRVKPQLQQLTGEYLQYSCAAGNEVRLEISARGFWQAGQMAILN